MEQITITQITPQELETLVESIMIKVLKKHFSVIHPETEDILS